MIRLWVLTTLLFSFSALAGSPCTLKAFIESPEGQEKLAGLVERSKSLILSKTEELGLDENKIQIKADYPKKAEDPLPSLKIIISSPNLEVSNSKFNVTKVTKEDECGIEISLLGGHVINRESQKDFGSLGRVKEFIRLN